MLIVLMLKILTMAFLLPVRLYQLILSPFMGTACRFHPTCSHYACEAVENFGIVRGGLLAVRRILRCHPWGSYSFDPVPTKENI